MIRNISLVGKEPTTTFTVENSGQEPIGIQAEMFQREISESGEDKRIATNDFNIYPPQFKLEVGGKRNIKVTWINPKIPSQELSYRFIVSQLPVELTPDSKDKVKIQLKFLLQYVASVYATPRDVKSHVIVDKVELTKDNKVRVTVNNKGTAHQLFRGGKLIIFGAKKEKIDLGPESEKVLESENILAGGTRVFDFMLPKAAPKGPYQAELRFDHP
jgi:fimbrial chaperone protein